MVGYGHIYGGTVTTWSLRAGLRYANMRQRCCLTGRLWRPDYRLKEGVSGSVRPVERFSPLHSVQVQKYVKKYNIYLTAD